MRGDSQQAAAAARNAEYRERYMRMRSEYRQLLRSRTDSIKKEGRLSQEVERNVLLGQLEHALRDEADLHRKESQRLNEELYLQEKKTCDGYVEKRLLQASPRKQKAAVRRHNRFWIAMTLFMTTGLSPLSFALRSTVVPRSSYRIDWPLWRRRSSNGIRLMARLTAKWFPCLTASSNWRTRIFNLSRAMSSSKGNWANATPCTSDPLQWIRRPRFQESSHFLR
jgi:hypothetical protein